METAGLSVESIMAQNASVTLSAYGTGVERKVLDMAKAEGAQLAQLMDSAGGLGQSISTYA